MEQPEGAGAGNRTVAQLTPFIPADSWCCRRWTPSRVGQRTLSTLPMKNQPLALGVRPTLSTLTIR
jgi:hypothetical protein